MGERGGSVFLRVDRQSGAAGEWPTGQGCPIFRPGGVSALPGLSQGPGAGKVHSSPTNTVAAMAPELCLTFWSLKAAELRTAEATHTRRKQRGFSSRWGWWKPFGELARPGGPWLSAPSRDAVMWLDIFPYGVRMSQTWRRGPGLVIIQAQGVEGQLLACDRLHPVTITMTPGEGKRSEESLKLNRETACGNDPVNEGLSVPGS